MNTKKTITLAAAFVGAISFTGTALATHKSWVIKNGGDDCSFYDPGSDDHIPGYFTNYTAPARTVTCPVSLSGRWGSSASPLFAPARWGAALSANVYVYRAQDFVFCFAGGQTDLGNIYFSNTAVASAAGAETLVVGGASNWGGDLEANQGLTLRSLDFQCNIAGSGANGPSSIFGYKVKICQLQQNCDDGAPPPHDAIKGTRGGFNITQSNGFECSPVDAAAAGRVTRNFDGIKNTSTTSSATVVCPIAPPADDSYEHGPRIIQSARVYYKGGATDSNCVAQGTCPECYLEWVSRNGTVNQSKQFAVEAFGGYLKEVGGASPSGADPASIIGEVQTNLRCKLPKGVTLNGSTAQVSVTAISGGV